MLNMIGINKFSKLAFMASLLVSSISWVHAMEDDPDLRAAIQASLQGAPVDNDDADFQAAIQESFAFAPQTPTNIGMDTSELTAEEVWALIQAQEAPNPVQDEEKKWTPQNSVPEGKGNYILQDKIPQAFTKNSPMDSDQPLAKVLRELESHKGAQVWQRRADQNEKQMQQRQVVHSLPQPNNQHAVLAHQAPSARLQAIQNLEAQKNGTQAAKPAPANMGVNSIAAQFGGQGSFKKPTTK